MEQPREFLSSLHGQGWLAGVAQQLREGARVDIWDLVHRHPESASTVLCQAALHAEFQPMEVKYVAYCLGQLGYRHAIPILKHLAAVNPVAGVRAAARAALNAVQDASADEGCSQVDRRRIIDRVYCLQ